MKTRIRDLRQSLKNIECSLSNEETNDRDHLASDSEQSSSSSTCSSTVQENNVGDLSENDRNENPTERPESSSVVSQGNAKRKTKTALHKLKEKKKRKYVTKRLNPLSTASDDSDSSDNNHSSSMRQKNANRRGKKKIVCSITSAENTISKTNQNSNHDSDISNRKMETNLTNDESKPHCSGNNNSLKVNLNSNGELNK